MRACKYPVWVKTIEAIRLANYRKLLAELAEDRDPLKGVEIASALGISAAYVSQLERGIRDSIDSKAARKIERTANKPEGWMDTDFDLWPFPDAGLLAEIESLKPPQRVEVQLAIRQALELLRKPKSASGESSYSHRGSGQKAA